jgi:hypothetical protein
LEGHHYEAISHEGDDDDVIIDGVFVSYTNTEYIIIVSVSQLMKTVIARAVSALLLSLGQ